MEQARDRVDHVLAVVVRAILVQAVLCALSSVSFSVSQSSACLNLTGVICRSSAGPDNCSGWTSVLTGYAPSSIVYRVQRFGGFQ